MKNDAGKGVPRFSKDTKFQDPFSEEVWATTYKDHKDESIDDTLMRVAMAIASVEETPEKQREWGEKFYDMLTDFKCVAGGRIMSNAGTEWGGTTLMNCFVSPRRDSDIDSLDGILEDLKNQAKTLKSEGGWGISFSHLRPRGAFIHGIGVESPGAVKYMELFDKSSEIVTSGSGKKSSNSKAKGKIRKGAMMSILSVYHPDIIEFITAKQTPGRLSKFNCSVDVCDLFMERLFAIKDLERQLKSTSPEEVAAIEDSIKELDKWDLIFPDTTFKAYKKKWNGSFKDWLTAGYPVNVYNTVSVRWLWNLITESTYNRNEPGVLFMDRANHFNPLNYAETITATNPCVTGDTEVYVADGRGEVMIKDLAIEGKDVPVFCFDSKGKLAIRIMRNPRITGIKSPVYEMLLDDGSTFRATGNHKFRKLDGSYVELKNLNIGDSLSVITKYAASLKDVFGETKLSTQDYWWINSGKGQNTAEHRHIAAFNNNVDVIPRGIVVHHKNFNAKDNSPDNLIMMTKQDHDKLHGEMMRGDNNPMRRATHEWDDAKWIEYRSNISKACAGLKNGMANPTTNDEIRTQMLELTRLLGRLVTKGEWEEHAKTQGLPVMFAKYRRDHLGDVTGLAKWAAYTLGYLSFDADPRTIRRAQNDMDNGYDVEMINDHVFYRKKCEVCGTPFLTPRREHGICGSLCKQTRNKIAMSPSVVERIKASSAKTFESKRVSIREKQAKIFNDVKMATGRSPSKNEWSTACMNAAISREIGRPGSPFKSFDELDTYASMQNHRIVDIKFVGSEDVYNGTVDEFHNFFISGQRGITKNGKEKKSFINNLQCGEQFLAPAGVCCLGTLNLTQFVKKDRTGFDLKSLKKYAGYLVRFLDDVNSYSDAPLPEYVDSMRNKRRVGCGVMGWGSSLLMMKVRFGSTEAVKIREELMSTFAKATYEASIDLAVEKGMFKHCVPSLHAEGAFVKSIGLSDDYMTKLMTTGIRNSALMSMQPNGNTSILSNIVSGGIEPVFMPEYIRTVIQNVVPDSIAAVTPKYWEGEFVETEMFKWTKEGDDEILRGAHEGEVYKIDRNRGLTKEVLCEDYGVRRLKEIGEWDPSADWVATAMTLTTRDHVEDLKGFARWVDSACSKTCTVANDCTLEEFKDLYLDVYKTGFIKGFTTYRAGTMASVLSAVDEKTSDGSDEMIILEDVKLPNSLPATLKKLKSDGGRKWYLTVVMDEKQTRPIAMFVQTNHHEKNVTTHDAVERLITLARRKGIPEKFVAQLEEKIRISDNASKIARAISLNLRHGVLIKNVVAVLDGIEEITVGSFLFAVKKYLSTYIKDGEKVEGEKCPACGGQMVFQEGCRRCLSCPNSLCS